jgi:hypothetical protein
MLALRHIPPMIKVYAFLKNSEVVELDLPGVDVMITIFCDFCQFSAKKMAFFLNTNVMINFFQNLALY